LGREAEDIENDTGIDYYPDVALGRLACTSVNEVEDVVAKIINYEKSKADPSWFKKVISILVMDSWIKLIWILNGY